MDFDCNWFCCKWYWYKNNSTVHMLCVGFCVSGGIIQLLFLQIEQIIGQTPQRLIKLLVRTDIILHKYHPGICKRNKTGIEWTLVDSFRFHLRACVGTSARICVYDRNRNGHQLLSLYPLPHSRPLLFLSCCPLWQGTHSSFMPLAHHFAPHLEAATVTGRRTDSFCQLDTASAGQQ